MIDMYSPLSSLAVKLFYLAQSWLYLLGLGLSTESCCDDNKEKIVNDEYMRNT